MLEPEKQQFLIDHLAKSAADFESVVASVDPAHWGMRPGPDQWSIGEIAEHVLIIDRRVAEISGTLAEWPEETFDGEHCARKDELILRVALERESKIEAPPQVRPTGKMESAAEFYPGFRACNERMIRTARDKPELLRGRFREHPFLKKLDGYQWLLVCSCHRKRHLAQIEDVKKIIST